MNLVGIQGNGENMRLQLLKVTMILASLTLTFINLQAQEVTHNVFHIQKSLKLSPNEPDFHDYYINAGRNKNLKVGHIVDVVRKKSIHDDFRSKQVYDIKFPVAELILILVEENMSVGRLHKMKITDKSPVLDFNSIMSGDQVLIESQRKPQSISQPKVVKSKPEKKEEKKEKLEIPLLSMKVLSKELPKKSVKEPEKVSQTEAPTNKVPELIKK